jgi:hypothetical protein
MARLGEPEDLKGAYGLAFPHRSFPSVCRLGKKKESPD